MYSSSIIELSNFRKSYKQSLNSLPGFNNKNFSNNFNFADFLESLEIWTYSKNSAVCSDPSFNSSSNSKKESDFLNFILSAKNKNLINDFVGIGKKTKNRIVFSLLIQEEPKPYIMMYLLFVKKIKKIFPNFEFIVYLEDWLPKYYSDIKTNKIKVSKYKRFITEFDVADRIVAADPFFYRKIIELSFVKEFLKNIKVADFLDVLPFQRRHPEFILLYDLFHFIWNIFTIKTIPGIYLTSINSKREFLIFRKALGGDLPVIFFPIAPESASNVETLEFYSNYFMFAQEKANLNQFKKFLYNFNKTR